MLQLSWEKLRREPATRWFDESFAPINKFEDRFARQNPFEPPSRFLVTSPYSVIDHHLSGLSSYTLTRILQPLVYKNWLIVFFNSIHFHCTLFNCFFLVNLYRYWTPWPVFQDGTINYLFATNQPFIKQPHHQSVSLPSTVHSGLDHTHYNLLLPF